MENNNTKLIFQFDPNLLFGFDLGNHPPENIVKAVFQYIDSGKIKVDEIFWEAHFLLPVECETNYTDSYLAFTEKGIDIMEILLAESKKRGIKNIFHHRFAEVDRKPNPIKAEHPDWIIKTWWHQGLWNAASHELRQFKLQYLTSIIQKYDFDGICIDFLRHTPCLPPGKEWENRHSVTKFMADLKKTALSIKNPFEIGAKVPENRECCELDGFDVGAWAAAGIVDFLELGSRTISVDVGWYKKITQNTGVKLYPCWDVGHASDARHFQSEEFYAGLFRNWIADGADGIAGFNHSSLTYEDAEALGINIPTKGVGNFKEMYNMFTAALNPQNSAMYTTDRRGGYPYCAGNTSSNFLAPLPMNLPNNSDPAEINIETRCILQKESAKARFVIYNAKETDVFKVFVNGTEVRGQSCDYHFIDRQIWKPKQQHFTSTTYFCLTDTPSDLLELCVDFDISLLNEGMNTLGISVIDRTDYAAEFDNISVERAEIFVK